MKTRHLPYFMACLLALLMLTYTCGCTQVESAKLADQLNATAIQVKAAADQTAQTAKEMAAANGGTDAKLNDLASKTSKIATVTDSISGQVAAYNAKVQAAATAPNPDAAAQAATVGAIGQALAPLAGPYAPLVSLGIGLVTGWLTQKRKTTQATAAGNSAVDAVTSALQNGSLKATTTAGSTIDNAVIAHPITDRLVDAVNLATSKGP